jgi:imidazolonepropionase-like amidohydrolase
MKYLLLQNASILDLAGGATNEGSSVLVEGRRIKEVAQGQIKVNDAEIIDLRGRFLIPGLCDAHVHVTAATADFAALLRWSPFYAAARAGDILRAMLLRGFTTLRDAGGADSGLAQTIEEGYLTGPRLLFCGKALSQTGGHGDMRGQEGYVIGPRLLFCGKALSQTGGHGDMRGRGENFDDCLCCAGLGRICDGVAAVRQACRDEVRKGATHIKIMASGGVASPTDRITSTQFSVEEITAAVEEAEAASLYVMAHAYTARAIARAVRCGVRSIEHGSLIDSETMDLMVEQGAYLVPTMSTHQALAEEGVTAGMPKALCDKVFEVMDAGRRNLPEAWRRGVKMVYGTDLLGSMHRQQLLEFALRGEFQRPLEVIRSATTVAAELFQMDGEIGVVAPGACADMLVYDRNPADDLGVLQAPERFLRLIVKDGTVYKNTLAD